MEMKKMISVTELTELVNCYNIACVFYHKYGSCGDIRTTSQRVLDSISRLIEKASKDFVLVEIKDGDK